ncbi:hypothetical protein [Shinella zoogloeoides]|uniref:hypothetical protein n=1 Tax=Shinella zoogloeoides TaxID=352475 RepID=UPI00299E6937|nr:hypothetical protein [Shinella zoogloeoides]WPE19927.1 hypothetical protein ShzoTeo12_11030 [Shinella zoogloeoides]
MNRFASLSPSDYQDLVEADYGNQSVREEFFQEFKDFADAYPADFGAGSDKLLVAARMLNGAGIWEKLPSDELAEFIFDLDIGTQSAVLSEIAEHVVDGIFAVEHKSIGGEEPATSVFADATVAHMDWHSHLNKVAGYVHVDGAWRALEIVAGTPPSLRMPLVLSTDLAQPNLHFTLGSAIGDFHKVQSEKLKGKSEGDPPRKSGKRVEKHTRKLHET